MPYVLHRMRPPMHPRLGRGVHDPDIVSDFYPVRDTEGARSGDVRVPVS